MSEPAKQIGYLAAALQARWKNRFAASWVGLQPLHDPT
jgi:hypothetical protein